MVAKIMQPTPSVDSPLSYNEEKVQKSLACVIGEFNKPERDETVIDALERLERHRLRSRSVSFHMSINPSETESLSDGQVRDFVSDMMNGLGYGSQPYIIYKHTDIDRTHFHVVSIRIKEDGRRINDRQEHRKCQKVLKELSSRYGYMLGNGDGLRYDSEGINPHRFNPSAGQVVAQMKAIAQECCRYHMTTFSQFKLIMASHGIDVHERAGDDITLVLRGLDSKGRPCTAPISERELGLALYKTYEQRALDCCNSSGPKSREKQKISNLAGYCLAYSQSQRHLCNMLYKQNINLYVHRTKDGRIYGATFIDNSTKCAFKCSELPGFSVDNLIGAESSGQWILPEDNKEQNHSVDADGGGNLIGDMLASMGQKSSKSKEKDLKKKKKGKKV